MIDLRLDEEQLQIQESLRSFAAEKIRPAAHDADETGRVPDALVAQAWELGLVQGSIPEQYGGYGQSASAVTGTVIAETMAEGDLAFALHALSPRLVIDPVLHLGSDEQKKEILPLYCGDRFVAGSAAVSEPRWNFSATELETTATRVRAPEQPPQAREHQPGRAYGSREATQVLAASGESPTGD